MEDFLYTCGYCSKKFEPKRRGHQIYCSNSCRSKAYRKRKQSESGFTSQLSIIENNEVAETVPAEIYSPSKQKIEEMSMAGVGNAAAGALLANTIKAIGTAFIPEENKNATKKDVNELKSIIAGNRYFQVKNLDVINGKLPYFDLETRMVVYF